LLRVDMPCCQRGRALLAAYAVVVIQALMLLLLIRVDMLCFMRARYTALMLQRCYCQE